ncbi:thrombospondin type-1 domain-containing protein 7B-like [Conger conger]|uniref:thrombospondin type-1 domain-containing protein 7B-like n=1 Tax=Conger conger TaxID=82655 RepID=UPI002A5AEC06|nr:thrombospondin type-1 domain-containing protein 7B-like [Conger conger]
MRPDRKPTCWTMIVQDDFGVVARTWQAESYLLLIVSLLVLQANADLEFPKENHYTWKMGQWGRCMGEDCGPGGVQTRTVWCIHTEGWTTHHSNCPHAEKPESQRRCFKVCEWHQELFEWAVSEWGPCVLTPHLSNEVKPGTAACVTAQHGVQRRAVLCARKSNRTAVTERICDFFSQRPAAEQACLIPCPHDCVASAFSHWSACSRTCGAGLQHRTRAVLATPMYGGANCPNLTQIRTCRNPLACPEGQERYRYSLKVGPWSECRLPHSKAVWLGGRTTVDLGDSVAERNSVEHRSEGARRRRHHPHHHGSKTLDVRIGYQTRQVRCTQSDGRNVMLSLCIHDNTPMTFQSCEMPRDCEMSDWSLWSPCSKTCRAVDLSPGYRTRTRNLKQTPIGGGKECPPLEEKEACNIVGDLLPECPRFVWKSTDWGDCQVAPLLSQQDRRQDKLSALCGGGIQTRDTYCVQVPDDSTPHHTKDVSRPVNSRLCVGNIPSSVQPCHIPCPEECLVSTWSDWGPCLHDNCMEPQGKKGFKQRRRQIEREPAGESQSCPHLAEAIPCEDPICFLLSVTSEEPCVPTQGPCGPGTQNQSALCTSTQGEVVPIERCSENPDPSPLPCEVPCPGDCVIGPWSEWSPCTHSCSTKHSEGRQSRARAMLALPGEGKKPCPAPPALEEWRHCNEHPCLTFYWEASPWSPCMEDSSTATLNATSSWNGSPTCTVGVQTRRVSCIKMNVGQVIPKRCPDSSRPDTIRPCLLPCRTDCIVTPFSEWTSCLSSCFTVNATAATQSRYRIIIQRSANGGQECPDTLYEERECDSLPVCPTYRWKTQKWHECTLVPESVRQGSTGAGEPCGRGLETRAVTCVGEDEEPVDVMACLQSAGAMPPQVRECRVPCRDDCTLSSWSKFSECPECGGWRSRKRTLTGRSKKREKCQRMELYPLMETEACPCAEFLSQPYGNWSDCILHDAQMHSPLQGWRVFREAKECGQGIRYRALACLDQEDQLVDPTFCSSTGYVEDICHVPCPLDCKLSDWSAWSGCSAPCGSGVKVRSRWLREKAFNGGRPCPKLDLKNQVYEAVPCYSECGQYVWVTEPWSVCTINSVDKVPDCGEGVQSRKVKCVQRGSEGPGDSVDDRLCDQEEIPFRAQICYLPCPDDCVMSEWSQWITCPLPCDQNTTRSRSRTILRLPEAEKTCPDANETEACILNSTCFTYHYNLSDWSTCQLSENAICGKGTKMRLLDCVRSDGKVVELTKCKELGLVRLWKLSARCVVDCPVSCLLSEWSPWTACSHTCGSQGQMMRSRSVLQQAQEEGRPCSPQLSQTKPCPIRPCYTWLLGQWSECHVEGAECGEGVRVRNLTCVVDWGGTSDASFPKAVEEDKCEDKLRKASAHELLLPCSVPCPGDCHLTEWSPWSSCQLTCLDGRSFETTGQQARSRAVVIQVEENQDSCPHQIFQTRPCKGGKCHTYEWRTSAWSDNERSVWCQRSDGVNVTGGCFLQNRPTTVRHCYPPCTKPFSYCTQSGVCGCERGYTEVMTTHGFLDYCTKTPGSDNKKADVKTNSGRLKPGNSQIPDFFTEWSLRPVGPDGRIKLWVYGVTAGGFLLIGFIIALLFVLCRKQKQSKGSPPTQKPLTLAYDGDVDM